MKLLIFSCLVAFALARPDARLLSINSHLKIRDLENRLNEDLIQQNEISSSEELNIQPNEFRRHVEKYELNKPREELKISSNQESITLPTEERVRRQIEYNFNEEDFSASNERRLQEERPLYFRYQESLYPTELRRLQKERDLYQLYLQQPELYYQYTPLYVPQYMAYPAEASISETRNAQVASINRATEAVFTHSEEENKEELSRSTALF